MYCKGYEPNGLDGLFGNGLINAVKEFENDAGFTSTTGVVTSKLLKALLNTESFRLIDGGDSQIRLVQQSLNQSYSDFMDLIPCNGIYEKFTNKGLIKALQHEIGVTTDGIFGSGTMSKCPTLRKGASAPKALVLIIQYALYCNKCDPNGFDGVAVSGNGSRKLR